MRESDLSKVVFYSREDMAWGHSLQKGEHILRADLKAEYLDVNEVLEIYNLKKFLDNEMYLQSWTQDDIVTFKNKIILFSKVIGRFMATINDKNVLAVHGIVLQNYINSFWELLSNQKVFKRISKNIFSSILEGEPFLINEILTHKPLVQFYSDEIKSFLLTYSQSAELILSVYEVKDDFRKKEKFLPHCLNISDKETILSDYLDSNSVNYNYIKLIQNAKNRKGFKISDKLRLKAKRLHKSETEKIFAKNQGMGYGVSVSFPKKLTKIKDGYVDDEQTIHYSYSADFIKENNAPYFLFKNFKILFEYLDNQNRIELVSKKDQVGLLENLIGVRSENEYRVGSSFSISEMTAQAQIILYSKVVNEMNNSLENILHSVFTIIFQEKYNFATNARLFTPTAVSFFEKVRLLAPEFESALKQYKLFVENGIIDFELLQISSSPSAIKDIPSLNPNKYIYLNESNNIINGCSNILFSNQTLLAYVKPFKEEKYSTFFDLLANEEVHYSNYEDYQKPKLDYLIENNFITVDSNDKIQFSNISRVLILKDLRENEVGSFYHYQIDFQHEVKKMLEENIIYLESTLFSKPEQSYFNYFLNKKEFTNGIDLRNSYLHGSQADPCRS